MVVKPIVLDLHQPVSLVLKLEQAPVGLAQVPEPKNRVAPASGESIKLIWVVVKVSNSI